MGEMADYDAGDGIDDWPGEARVEFDAMLGGRGSGNVAVGGNGPPIKVYGGNAEVQFRYSVTDWHRLLVAAEQDCLNDPDGFIRRKYDDKYPKAVIDKVLKKRGYAMIIDVDARVQQVLEERQVQAEVEKRLKLIEAYGDDNFPEGAVIRFKKQFRPDSTAYSYAAIKANGQWYTSGPKSTRAYSWLELVAWLVAGVPVTNIEKMIPTNE
jgi:hypothetical protein